MSEQKETRCIYKVSCQTAEDREKLRDLVSVLKKLAGEKSTCDYLTKLMVSELFRTGPPTE